MKQFIYLDSDIVNSIIAQKEKGLAKGKKSEDEQGLVKNENNNVSSDINGGIKSRLFKYYRC